MSTSRPRIREAIVVEGRYDRTTLSQAVDAMILTTEGFSVFNDREKLAFIRRIAAKQGVILLTDSDGAGFVIRNYLKGALPHDQVRQGYIPDVPGKERRKKSPGKEGKLGVEGMPPETLLEVLRRCGATFLDEMAEPERPAEETMTKADLYALGLSGTPDSRRKRQLLARELSLPERLSANALLEAVNQLGLAGNVRRFAESQRTDGAD